MKSKTKHERKPRPASRPPSAPRRSLSRRGMLSLAGAMLLTGIGTWALFEYVIWNTTPPELVGSWIVVRGPQDQVGSVFEFRRNGTLVGHIDPDGRHHVLNATIRVEDNKIFATTRHPATGEELTRVQTIRKLTRMQLVLKDEQDNLMVMERE